MLAERLDLTQAQAPGDPGVVAQGGVGVQRQMHRVQGAVPGDQLPDPPVLKTGEGHGLAPEQAVVHEQHVGLPLHGPADRLQADINCAGHPGGLAARVGHLQPIVGGILRGCRCQLQGPAQKPIELRQAHVEAHYTSAA